MPTYEYECPEGHAFEKLQKMSDKPRANCPTCGRRATRKISGGAGLVFKGSGFYITDYGKDGKGPRKAPVEGGGEAAKADAPAAKTEGSAPAEKADAKPSKAKEKGAPKKASE